MATPIHPVTDVRRDFSSHLRTFRASPQDAKPIVIGSRGQAEAVLLPTEQYRGMLDHIEALTARAEAFDVLAKDSGARGDIAGLARDHDFDPTEFGLD